MSKKYFVFLALTFTTLSMNLFGSGLMLYEISAPRVRLGSAGWAASANDPSTVFSNPAGMTRFCSPQLEAGLEPIYLHVHFEPDENTEVLGDDGVVSPWIPAGGLFYVHPINSQLSLGFGGLGFFGSSLKYNSDWVGRYYLTEATLQGFSAAFSAAYRVNSCLSIGAGYTPNLIVFKQKGKINNVLDSLPDGELELKDTDWGHGYYLGLLYEFNPCTRVGVQYLSDIKYHLKDVPDFKDVGPTLNNLISITGLDQNPVVLDVRVPKMVTVGFSHDINSCLSVVGDVGWQEWSKFGKVEITLGKSSDITLTAIKKYKDAWHAALGFEYYYCPSLLVSFGGAYDSSCVTKEERTFDFPVGEQWRFGTGFRWEICCNTSIDAAYSLQWGGDLPIDRNRGPLAGRVSGHFVNTFAHFANISILRNF